MTPYRTLRGYLYNFDAETVFPLVVVARIGLGTRHIVAGRARAWRLVLSDRSVGLATA